MQFRLKSTRIWVALVLLLSTNPARASNPPPPAAAVPPRPCQMMLKTMQNLNDDALERDCMSWHNGENDPTNWQHAYGVARQPPLHLNAQPRSCVAAWVERKLREDPAGCELSESSPEAKELRKLLLERAADRRLDQYSTIRQAAIYLLCLQQVPEALPWFIENIKDVRPEDACVAAWFRFPHKSGEAQEMQSMYSYGLVHRRLSLRPLFIPSAFGSESDRLVLVPLLLEATNAHYRGRDELAQRVCQPAPTLPELIKVCQHQGPPREVVWQLMAGVTSPGLLTSEEVEYVLRSLRTTWQFDPECARRQIEQLCLEYQQTTEALTQSCQKLRRQPELWLPLAKHQRERLNKTLTQQYNFRLRALLFGLGTTVSLWVLVAVRMRGRRRQQEQRWQSGNGRIPVGKILMTASKKEPA